MSTEYQQVPSQQAFYSATHSDIDPWLITATNNMTIGWTRPISKGDFTHSPPLFEDHTMHWNPPPTPTYHTPQKPVIIPAHYISTSSTQDPWAIQNELPEPEDIEVSEEDTSSIGEDDTAQNLYKTELCRSFVETGACRYGVKCQFAHGKSELRPVLRHPKYKTEICKTFHTLGTCPYGTRCRFIHTRPKSHGAKSTSPPTLVSPPFSASSSPTSISPTSSRSPSPPSTVPAKWSTSWPREKKQSISCSLEENEGEVPDSPSAASKKRLAIFRTIC